MIELPEIPEECKTEHLFLLVGANPLPNFVSALLLRKPGCTFHLLHTGETLSIAENLRDRILAQHAKHPFALKEIDTTDGLAIRSALEQQLSHIPSRGSVGLNYTGGTKVMAVHAYRAMESQRPDAVFSYLNAQEIALRVDGGDGKPTISVSIVGKCPVTLDTLAQLHGYKKFKTEPVRSHDPKRNGILEAIRQIHLSPSGYEQWQKYLEQQTITDLPDLNQWPELQLFVRALEDFHGGPVSAEQAAMILDNRVLLNSCRKWLMGGWLEELVFAHIDTQRAVLGITDLGRGVEPISGTKQSEGFEFDVAATIGHQLFVASCIASTRKEKCEHHFFQVYTRARQFGGDELRTALICLYDKPKQMQAKIDESWLTEGRIRVFGREHLFNLSDHLRNWIATANQ